MNTAIELVELANLIKAFRKALVSNKGFRFLDSNMCILNRTYYIHVRAETIEIRSEKKEIKLSNTSEFYQVLKDFLEDVYYKKERKRKLIKRLDLLLLEIAKKHKEIIAQVEEQLMNEEL